MLWFAGASLLAVIALGFAATAILRRQARGEAIRDAKEITRLAGEGIAEPALNEKLLAGDRAPRRASITSMRTRVLKDPVVRVKLWTLDGRIVYSDERALVGRRFALEPEVMSAVRKRLVAADVSDLDRPENRYERRFGKLLEVYLPIDAPGGQRAAVRGLHPLRRDHRERAAPVRALRARLWAAALLLLWLVQLPLAWSLAPPPSPAPARARGAPAARHRLLGDRAPADRPAPARRRGAGPGRGLLCSPAAAGRHRRDRGGARRGARRGLAASVRELRALLIGIYPPSLQRSGLEAAVSDLLAPLSARGIAVEAEIAATTSRSPRRPRS